MIFVFEIEFLLAGCGVIFPCVNDAKMSFDTVIDFQKILLENGKN